MRARRLIPIVLLLAALGLAIALYTRDTPERRIVARVEQLELALSSVPGLDGPGHGARIERVVDEAIASDVVIAIPDFPELSRGSSGLGEVAKRAVRDPRGLEVSAKVLEVVLDSDGNAATAQVRAEVGRPGDELHKDVRHVTLRFARGSGDWRVTGITVAPKTHEEPEARP
jgi:hypothetical protein